MACNYADWAQRSNEINQYTHNKDKVWVHWYDEYKTAAKFDVGRKYIKLCHDNAVTGFIVAVKNDKKFEYGDLLKAASWSTPSRNFSRGNAFTDIPETIQWTGIG
jgi:hypothetical protein